jgi:hypothetical protein
MAKKMGAIPYKFDWEDQQKWQCVSCNKKLGTPHGFSHKGEELCKSCYRKAERRGIAGGPDNYEEAYSYTPKGVKVYKYPSCQGCGERRGPTSSVRLSIGGGMLNLCTGCIAQAQQSKYKGKEEEGNVFESETVCHKCKTWLQPKGQYGWYCPKCGASWER